MAVFLIMAVAALHGTGAQGGFVAFIFHLAMTTLAGDLLSVNEDFIFINDNLKFTFSAADPVAVDAILD